MTYHSDWSKVSTKEKVSSSLDCLWMLVIKHFNTHNVWLRDISEPLTPKTKLNDSRFYMYCVKRYLLCKSVTEVMFLFVMYMNESIKSTHRERVHFQGLNSVALFISLSKNNISPAAPDLELILFSLWYWPIMNTHTKQQQDKVFEMDFIDSQKSNPTFAHLSALSH